MLLLEKDTTWKKQVDKIMSQLEFEENSNKKYKVKVICNSAIYTKKLKSSYLPGLYYLVLWKNYSEKKKT